jgi:hypothetical protein
LRRLKGKNWALIVPIEVPDDARPGVGGRFGRIAFFELPLAARRLACRGVT